MSSYGDALKRRREERNAGSGADNASPSASSSSSPSSYSEARERRREQQNTTPAVDPRTPAKSAYDGVSFAQNQYTYTPAYTDTASSRYSREDILRILADNKVAAEQERQRQARNELRDQFMSERKRQAQRIYDTYGVSEPRPSTPDMRVVKPSDGGVAAYTDTGSRNYSREDVERELGVYNILVNNAKEDERKANRYENMSPDALKAEWQSKYDDRNAVWELLQSRVPYFDDAPYEGEEDRAAVQERRRQIANKYGLNLSNIDSFEEGLRRVYADLEKTSEVAYYDSNGNARTYANLYYDIENKDALKRIANDATLKSAYDDAERMKRDINLIEDLMIVKSDGSPHTEDFEYLRQRYGVDLRNSVGDAARSGKMANETAANELLAQIESRIAAYSDSLSDAGYNYARMSEYEKRQRDAKAAAEREAYYAELADKYPVLMTIANLFSGFGEIVDGIEAMISGSGSATPEGAGGYVPMNTALNDAQKFSQSVSSTVMKKIEDDIKSSDWLPFKDTLAWLASKGYGGVTSVAKSLLTNMTSVMMFGPAGEAIGLGLLGTEAGLNAMTEAAERGANNSQAIFYGMAAGINEALFEKVSLDHFLKVRGSWDRENVARSIFNILRGSAKQGAVEASEEVFTDLANRIADGLINGDVSEYTTTVEKYKKQGYSQSEAESKATTDFLEQLLESAYGGFIGGGASASVKSFGGAVRDAIDQAKTQTEPAPAPAEQTLTQLAEEVVAPTEPQVAPTATEAVVAPIEAEQTTRITPETENAKNEEITAPAETQMQTVNSENRRAWDALAAEYGKNGAEMMRGLYDDELDYRQLDAIARDFSAYYNAGVEGNGLMDVESAAKVEAFDVFDRDSDALTSMEIAAYEAGRQDAKYGINEVVATGKRGNTLSVVGTEVAEGIERDTVDLLKSLVDNGAARENIILYKSVNGKIDGDVTHNGDVILADGTEAPDGMVTLSDGTMLFDLAAGHEGTTLHTVAHEYGHIVAKKNPAAWAQITDFVKSRLGEEQFDKLVASKVESMKRSSLWKTSDSSIAEEDVVCDALSEIGTKGDFFEQLEDYADKTFDTEEEKRSFFQAIKDFFTNIINRLKKAYANLRPDTEAAKAMSNDIEGIQRLADMMAKAYNEISDAAATEIVTESYERYSINSKTYEYAKDVTGVSKQTEVAYDSIRELGAIQKEIGRNIRKDLPQGHWRMNIHNLNEYLAKHTDVWQRLVDIQKTSNDNGVPVDFVTPVGEPYVIEGKTVEGGLKGFPIEYVTKEDGGYKFNGFARSLSQLYVDRMNDAARWQMQDEFIAAVEDAYKKRESMTDPVPDLQKMLDTVAKEFDVPGKRIASKTKFSVQTALRSASKTVMALNLNAACPMFTVGNHGCYLDACYLTQMGAGGNTVNLFQSSIYAGEILQLSQATIDMLNADPDGLRINGVGDTIRGNKGALLKVFEHAAMRGLKLKIITKQEATLEILREAAKQGIDISNVTVQLSMDNLWIPAMLDDAWGSGIRGTVGIAQTIKKGNLEAASAGYGAIYGREARTKEGVLYRKYGFSAERVNELIKEYPEITILPRYVVTTASEIADLALGNGPLGKGPFIQTLMHGVVPEPCFSDYPGKVLNFGSLRHVVEKNADGEWEFYGARVSKNKQTGAVTVTRVNSSAHAEVDAYIKNNYTPAEQDVIYRNLQKQLCCKASEKVDACAGCQALYGGGCSLCAALKAKRNQNYAIPEDLMDVNTAYSARDTEYLELAQEPEKNKAELQRMVGEAAKDAGYETEAYHGTTSEFNSFDINKSRFGNAGYGFYFGEESTAKEYASDRQTKGKVMRVFAKTDNLATESGHNITPEQFDTALNLLGLSPEKTYMKFANNLSDYVLRYRNDYDIAYDLQFWADQPEWYAVNADAQMTPSEILSTLQKTLGVDGMRNNRSIVLWDNTLVKSADPVTYDDEGNVIPLSERFDSSNQDIRFSESDRGEQTPALQADAYAEMRRQLVEANRKLAEARGQLKKTPQPTVRKDDSRKLARDIIKRYGSNANVESISNAIENLGNLIVRGSDEQGDATVERVSEAAADIMYGIISTSDSVYDEDELALHKEIRDAIRSTPLYVSKYEKADVGDAYGSYNEFRKRNMGKLTTTNNAKAMRVDVFYQEMCDRFPWAFDPNITNQADQIKEMLRVAESELKPTYNIAEESEAEATDLIFRIISDVRQVETYADRAAKRLNLAIVHERNVAANARDRARAKVEKLEEQLREKNRKMNELRKQKNRVIEDIKLQHSLEKEQERERMQRREAEERLLKLVQRMNNTKLSKPNRAYFEQYFGDIYTIARSVTGQKLAQVADVEKRYKALSDPDSEYYDPNFIGSPRMEAYFAQYNKATYIADMTDEQLGDYIYALLELDYMQREQNRLIKAADRSDVRMQAYNVIADVDFTNGVKGNRVSQFADWMIRDVLGAVNTIRRYTGYNDYDPLYQRTLDLSRGEMDAAKYAIDSEAMFDPLLNNKKATRTFSGRNAEEIEITARAVLNGDRPIKLKITPAMRTALYMHLQNDDNMRHIADGGIVIPDVELLKKGKISDAYAKGTKVKFEKSELRKIVAGMSDFEVEFAKTAAKYFDDVSAKSISEVYEALHGVPPKMVGGKYFPIAVVLSATGNADVSAEQMLNAYEGGGAEIMNPGWLKERVSSKMPILLVPVDTVVNRAIQNHSRYVGLAIPLTNFNKVWNASLWGESKRYNSLTKTEETSMVPTISVKDAVADKWGAKAVNTINDFVDQISGRQRRTNASWFAKLRSNYAGAVLTMNPATALKQIPSGVAAAYIVGYKALGKAATPGLSADTSFIDDMTAAYTMRKKGYSSQELGELASNKRKLPAALSWIAGADLATTKLLKRAAVFYVRDNFKSLQVGSEAYKQKVVDVYEKIINETQPTYDVSYRAAALRSNNEVKRALHMFKTQPYKNFGIVYTAFGEMFAKRKSYREANRYAADSEESKTYAEEAKNAYNEAKKGVARAVTSQAISAMMIASIVAAWDMFTGGKKKYKDEDGEVTFFSFLKGLGINFASTGAGAIPFGSTTLEYAEQAVDKIVGKDIFGTTAYEFSIPEVDMLNNLLTSAADLAETIFSGDIKNPEKAARTVLKDAGDLLQAFGVPLKNVEKLTKAVLTNTFRASGKYVGEYKALRVMGTVDAYKQAHYDNLYKAYKNDKAQYQEIYNDLIDNGVTEKAIKDAMNERIKKEQGAEHISDVAPGDRYLSPTQKKQYDRIEATVKSSSVYTDSDRESRSRVDKLAYEVVTTDRWKSYAAVEDNNLNATEYVLYQLALDIVDQPDSKGNYGTYTDAEKAAAVKMAKGG